MTAEDNHDHLTDLADLLDVNRFGAIVELLTPEERHAFVEDVRPLVVQLSDALMHQPADVPLAAKLIGCLSSELYSWEVSGTIASHVDYEGQRAEIERLLLDPVGNSQSLRDLPGLLNA